MADEWSDWFAHDGQPLPNLIGVFVEAQAFNEDVEQGTVLRRVMFPPPGFHSSWVWGEGSGQHCPRRVRRYRIRQTRGMALLKQALRVSEPAQ